MRLVTDERDYFEDRMTIEGAMTRMPHEQSISSARIDAPYAVGPDEPLSQVLTTMIGREIDSVHVVSPAGIVVGIFTSYDALAMLRALILLEEREQGYENAA